MGLCVGVCMYVPMCWGRLSRCGALCTNGLPAIMRDAISGACYASVLVRNVGAVLPNGTHFFMRITASKLINW